MFIAGVANDASSRVELMECFRGTPGAGSFGFEQLLVQVRIHHCSWCYSLCDLISEDRRARCGILRRLSIFIYRRQSLVAPVFILVT